jgi:RNA polymerase-binding transcription factor DksA
MAKLTKKKLDELRTSLVVDREALVVQALTLATTERELTIARMSPDERTRNEGGGDQLAVERDLVAQLGEKSQTWLVEVDLALARMDAGAFGDCAGCGNPIPWERLEVRPQADRCVPCARRSR